MESDPVSLAIKEAKKSVHAFQHGAVLLDRRGNFLGKGYNNGLHAEIHALLKCSPNDRKGGTIYSIRLSVGHTKLASAKPCRACQAVLKKYGIRKVFYSTTSGEIRKMTL